jgi:hypothetical protein
MQQTIIKVLAVLAGYAIFVFSSLLLFKFSGQAPHAIASIQFQIITVFYGAIFSFLSGVVVVLIAKPKTLRLNYILAMIVAGFAIFSLVKTDGSHWTQLMAIFIFAPVSMVGGVFGIKRNNQVRF